MQEKEAKAERLQPFAASVIEPMPKMEVEVNCSIGEEQFFGLACETRPVERENMFE